MELKEVFDKRRSVNFFDSSKSIDEALIKKIYDVAKFAPSSFNLQPWKFILVSEPENKKKLREVAFNQEKVQESSVMIIMLADKEGYQEMEGTAQDFVDKGYFSAKDKSQYVEMAHNLYKEPFAARGFALRNAGLFAMSFMLAAKDLGVDTHPIDGFSQDGVKQAFNIPERFEVAMLIAVGYHNNNKTLLARLNRKDFAEVVIKEKF